MAHGDVADLSADPGRSPGLDHVTIATHDFPLALAFYDAALTPLGLLRLDELVDEEEDDPQLEAVGWGRPGGTSLLWLVQALPAARATAGLHVRLSAATRADVEGFHAAGLAAGGTDFAAPRRWAVYRRGDFNAILRDPAGNLVEAVAAE